jgi:hypothetical protein
MRVWQPASSPPFDRRTLSVTTRHVIVSGAVVVVGSVQVLQHVGRGLALGLTRAHRNGMVGRWLFGHAAEEPRPCQPNPVQVVALIHPLQADSHNHSSRALYSQFQHSSPSTDTS